MKLDNQHTHIHINNSVILLRNAKKIWEPFFSSIFWSNKHALATYYLNYFLGLYFATVLQR